MTDLLLTLLDKALAKHAFPHLRIRWALGYAIISGNQTVYKKAKKQQKVTQAQSALTHGTETKRSTSQTPL